MNSDEASGLWLAWGLGLFYGVAGLLHLVYPQPILAITPDFVPMPELVVALTGIAEILGAAGLQFAAFRRVAGLGLALYALCVWPANWKHAFDALPIAGMQLGWWYHAPRLAAQPLLMLAALHAGGWRLRHLRRH